MEYELNYFASSNVQMPSEGPFIANGKLGIVYGGKDDGIAANRVFISKNVEYKNGQYQPNVVDVFNTFNIEFFPQYSMLPNIVTNTSQCLNMDTAIARNTFNISSDSNATFTGSGSNLPTNFVFDDYGNYVIADDSQFVLSSTPFSMQVSSSVYAVRHMPYSTMQTVECSNISHSNIRILHESWTRDNIVDVSYENALKYTGTDLPIYMFIGSGRTHDNIKIAFVSSYLFDINPSATLVKPMGTGTNLQSSRTNFQFNCFDINGLSSGTFKFHVLTTHITQHDFDDPRAEAIRIATSLCSPSPVAPTQQAMASYIRGRHVDAWGKLWATKIKITPKPDATLQQTQEIRAMNTYLYSSLYHMYSCIRENFTVDTNPNAIPLLDIDGSLLYEGDTWLVPLLLILKPEIARTIIEYRFNALQSARQLAASYGFEGAKIPYIDDIIGYKNNLYYNTSSYVYVFNSCMVAINTWNYYRMSRDKNWLQNRGYSILKEIALYLNSLMSIDEETGDISLNNVIALNTRASDSNNTFTNNLAKLVFKYAVEASYELNYDFPASWLEIYNALPIDFYPSTRIFKFDGASLLEDKFNVLEMLHLFMPGMWENLSRNNTAQFADIVRSNYNYYTPTRIIPGDALRPTNIALRGICAGVVMTYDGTYLPYFMSHLEDFISNHIYGAWFHMRPDTKNLNRRPPLPFEGGNSLTTNALFIMLLLGGMLQMRIVGGISDTRFYYQDLKLAYASTATMPYYWGFVSVTNYGMGNNKGTIDVRQNIYDVQNVATGPYPGGTFLSNGDFSIYTP